jgi:hypothetical protein
MGLRRCCEVCNCNFPEAFKCETCEGTGFKIIPDNQIVFINVYEVERHFGGHEEGGWYFNALTCVETFPVRNSAADDMVEVLTDENQFRKWGNIASVLGGTDVVVQIDEEPKQYETKERPYYC